MHFPGKTTLSAAALGVVLVFAWGSAQAADEKDRISPSAIQQGFAASPIPKEELNLKGKEPAQVALGSYLTFAGDCVGCHSFPRFLRPGGTPTNISGQGSAPQYGEPFDPPPLGLGGYDPNKLQTMPWVTYHNLTDTDLKAIYAYLGALPKARGCNNPENGCPGFSTPPGTPAGKYAYAPTDECPNPPTPQ